MGTVRLFLGAHLAALLFGLAGLLIALPNPQLWAGDATATLAFNFGMRYAGSLHIIFGAATMLAFGIAVIGWGKTFVFFISSTTISLGAELLGTTTGQPFGDYAYTDFLGAKIAGHVPFSIPLSWFYLGFAAYLLGSALVSRWQLRPSAVWAVGLGVWLLVVWDLVLDPAMAHAAMPIRFWEWGETGAYLGMPLKNFGGWALTGLPFMALSRLLWRENVRLTPQQIGVPLVVYVANVGFAMALSASVGLWLPIGLVVCLGLLPLIPLVVTLLPRRAPLEQPGLGA